MELDEAAVPIYLYIETMEPDDAVLAFGVTRQKIEANGLRRHQKQFHVRGQVAKYSIINPNEGHPSPLG